MFELLLSIFCSYRNAQLAKRKGQNTVLWVSLTIAAFFFCFILGTAILVLMLYKGPQTPEGIQAFLIEKPLLVVTAEFFGLGGYLFTRYLLERMPDTDITQND